MRDDAVLRLALPLGRGLGRRWEGVILLRDKQTNKQTNKQTKQTGVKTVPQSVAEVTNKKLVLNSNILCTMIHNRHPRTSEMRHKNMHQQNARKNPN